MKAKQLQKGLRQLGEEGAVQVFEPLAGYQPLIGAVGQAAVRSGRATA